MATQFAREKAAQAWCKPETEKINMIPELAEAFAEIIDEILGTDSEETEDAKAKP